MAGPTYLDSTSNAWAIQSAGPGLTLVVATEFGDAMELALGGVFGGAEMALGGISEYTNTSAMWNNNSISAKLAASFKSATCLERKKRNSVDAASAAESSSLVWTLHARHRVRN